MRNPTINYTSTDDLLFRFELEERVINENCIKYNIKPEDYKGRIRVRSRRARARFLFKSTSYGNFEVISRDGTDLHGHQLFGIRFVNTKYEVHKLRISYILDGQIKDVLAPTVCGVGYIGLRYKEIKENYPEIYKNMYDRWTNMLKRCYDKKNNRYHVYGGIGIKVCKKWHNFSNYFYDAIKLDGFDINILKTKSRQLTLDKDKLQQDIPDSEKIYSPKTCCWITISEQNTLVDHDKAQDSLKKYFTVTTPTGEVYIGKGIGKFARKYNLDPGDCSRSRTGKIDHVKGFRFKPATEEETIQYINSGEDFLKIK